MPLQFRRGIDSQRSTVTPAAGEPLWITDTGKLYIGDGTSTGGIEVSGSGSGGAPTNASYIVLGTNASLSAERALSIGTGLASTDGGAGGTLSIALATHTHSASDIATGTVALARGGLAADISTTGGTGQFLRQTAAGAAVSVAIIAATDLPTHNHAASNITSGTLALSVGGLAANISATGGTAQFLKQTAAGGAVSVGTIAATEVGTSGTPSTSTFLRGDMQWSAPPGGSGTKTYARFTPLDNQPTTSAYATFDTRNGIAVLDFDPTAAESAVFVSFLPEAAVTTDGLKVRLVWTPSTSTTTNAVIWGAALQRLDTSTDIDTDSFGGTVTASAVASGTAGIPTITEITLTGTTNLDSVSAGDAFRLKVTRDATAGGDDLADDAELIAIELRAV